MPRYLKWHIDLSSIPQSPPARAPMANLRLCSNKAIVGSRPPAFIVWLSRYPATASIGLRGIGDPLQLIKVLFCGRNLSLSLPSLGVEPDVVLVRDALGIRGRDVASAPQLRQFVQDEKILERPLPIGQPHRLPPSCTQLGGVQEGFGDQVEFLGLLLSEVVPRRADVGLA